ncbi:MAG TPA: ribonuclease H-like domain-containing protein [Candidatus Dormibacteraeota bacterium]|nr:ribonuclease H-like domain-containing protein [Candidatus Dormibacteraeota bacterium]
MASSANRFSRLAALRPSHSTPTRPLTLREPSEEDTLARLLGAGVSRNRFGEHLTVRNWFYTPEFAAPDPTALELLSRTGDPTLSRRTRQALENPERWLFLDTETTGLAGGTGTYAFLIGLAWWDAGGLQVEQLFMRDFSEEHSVLCELAARLADRPVLITFNGKTFDWPLLESRFTMTRSIGVPQLAAHLDLLHPARALWKLRLGSVRLVELERQVLDPVSLGWHREDDITSAFIPQYYFDYLRGGPPEPLTGITRHNQMDLRGLAALSSKINALLSIDSSGQENIHALDLFGLSRFLQHRGEADRAHSACAQALDLGLPSEFRPRARRELAMMAKRKGHHFRAAELWHEIVADSQHGIYACEQLAIYYERRVKNYVRAVEFARLALFNLRRSRSNNRDPYITARYARLEGEFLKRIARLESRMTPHAAESTGKVLPLI